MDDSPSVSSNGSVSLERNLPVIEESTTVKASGSKIPTPAATNKPKKSDKPASK
jgi:hypothetical protein